MNIHSKAAIVTGASSGLGAAFSHALIQKDAVVYGLARTAEKLNSLQKNLGKNFIPVPMDISNSDKLEYWVTKTFSNEITPDILINNAGIGIFGSVDKLSLNEWNTMITTNLSGVFYLTRLIVPLMKENPRTTHIINIASIAGKVGNPELSGYNASKFGLRGFSESLMKELRYDGIKVSCFFPGSTATSFFKHTNSGNSEAHSNMMNPTDVANLLIHVLETPDNFLIDEIVMRPLNPKRPAN